MALRQDDFQTIRQGHALEGWQLYIRRGSNCREFRTVHARACHLVVRKGRHLEWVEPIAQPAPRRIAQILCRCFAHPLQRNQVLFRISSEYLAASEDVGFPAEASDAVEPPHEIRFIGGLDALQLFGRWPVPQEFVQPFLNALVFWRAPSSGFPPLNIQY